MGEDGVRMGNGDGGDENDDGQCRLQEFAYGVTFINMFL